MPTPSNRFIDAMLSLDFFDVSTWLSWIPKGPLHLFLYRNLRKISSGNAELARGSFARARLATDKVLEFLRSGRAEVLDADILSFEGKRIRFNHRPPGGPRGALGQERLIEADMCVLASGYQAPSLHFLPEDCLQEPYTPPNWYLQAFPPTHMDICAINCAYTDAVGPFGLYHVAVYTRFLLMCLVDPLARPSEKGMKKWADLSRWFRSMVPR